MSIFRYRLTYKKTGTARYIGHLDLQNLFQRSVRRAGLRARYSQGFNPHPIISFASPLAVGIEGLAELADIDLIEQVDVIDVVEQLNNAFPAGISVSLCKELALTEKSAAALLRKARYRIQIRTENGGFDAGEAVLKFLSSNDGIRNLVYEAAGDGQAVEAVIACGGAGNLKPGALAEAICSHMGTVLCQNTTEYTRMELIF